MNLPNVAGTLSDSDKIGWDDKDQTVSRLLYQLSILDDFPNLSNFTEVDPDGKVNLAGGVITMDGTNAWGTHGIYHTAGVTRADGYFEIKASMASTQVGQGAIQVHNSAALPLATNSVRNVYFTGNNYVQWESAEGQAPYSINTWYTIRIYVGKSSDGSTWKYGKITIEGGVYSTETIIGLVDFGIAIYADPMYFVLQRYDLKADGLASFKEFRWYTGYDTGGEYIEYIHDAGASQLFIDFDLTNFAMPNSIDTTNLLFAYSHDNGTPSFSGWLTLANLKAAGAQGTDKRYIRIRVQSNSDGDTQVYGAKPDAAGAIVGIGAVADFPDEDDVALTVDYDNGNLTGNRRQPPPGLVADGFDYGPSDSLQGTLEVKDLTFQDEIDRNDDVGEENILASVGDYLLHNDTKTPTLELVDAPGVPQLFTPHYSDNAVALEWTYVSSVVEYQLWVKEGAGAFERYPNASTTFTALSATVIGLTAETTYTFKVTAVNGTGSTDSNELGVITTPATPILTRFEAELKTLAEAMTTVAGYNFNWGTMNQPDHALKGDYPNGDLYQLQEDNLDLTDENHAQAYGNVAHYQLVCHGKLTDVADVPKWEINAETNKIVDDIKELLGRNEHVNDTVNVVQYMNHKREFTKDGDVFIPGNVLINIDIWYAQDRRTPTANAN